MALMTIGSADLAERDQLLERAARIDVHFLVIDEYRRARLGRAGDRVELPAERGTAASSSAAAASGRRSAGAAAADAETPERGERTDLAVRSDRGHAPVERPLPVTLATASVFCGAC